MKPNKPFVADQEFVVEIRAESMHLESVFMRRLCHFVVVVLCKYELISNSSTLHKVLYYCLLLTTLAILTISHNTDCFYFSPFLIEHLSIDVFFLNSSAKMIFVSIFIHCASLIFSIHAIDVKMQKSFMRVCIFDILNIMFSILGKHVSHYFVII